MYNTIAEMLALAEKQGVALWEIVLQNERRLQPDTDIFAALDEHYSVMRRSAERAFCERLSMPGSLIAGVSARHNAFSDAGGGLCGSFINRVMARALSCCEVNASMGRVCAAPTAGACGILPAVLISVGEELKLDHEKILHGLLTAAGIGAVIMQNATVSGAEGGCQAECGVAAAMSAAAAVQLAGGSGEAAVHACAIALMNVMGLICDPVAGLVQVPCAQRNASQAVNALISADLALAGMRSVIPVDEVVESMYKVGRMLPEQLRETSTGGVADTAAAKSILKRIFE